MKVAIITSAYNEEAGIEEYVNQIKYNFELLNNEYSNLQYELVIANNKSFDKTLNKLIELKKSNNFLRVFDNQINLGYDISILNTLRKVKADYYVVMCSDLEDPPELAFSMLKKLIKNEEIDSILAVKKTEKKSLLNLFRFFYYLFTSFSTRTNFLSGYHGFGAYKRETIQTALIYSEKVSPDVRKSLLWASSDYKFDYYKKGLRGGGKSSYTKLSYFLEGFNQLINSPSLSSRLSLRFAFLITSFLILLGIFFILNFFINIMIFPPGTTTVIILILLNSAINCFLLALNSRQIENLTIPNKFLRAKSKEI